MMHWLISDSYKINYHHSHSLFWSLTSMWNNFTEISTKPSTCSSRSAAFLNSPILRSRTIDPSFVVHIHVEESIDNELWRNSIDLFIIFNYLWYFLTHSPLLKYESFMAVPRNPEVVRIFIWIQKLFQIKYIRKYQFFIDIDVRFFFVAYFQQIWDIFSWKKVTCMKLWNNL